ncbi:MAG TPA: hypothetical protein VN325_44020 [Steroidobacteraceae bacterium]|nr:hypothetical protein [Steroidobacteraceae bacterium]
MEDQLGDFNRGVAAIEKAIVHALDDNGVKYTSVSRVTRGSGLPDSIAFQITANGRSHTEPFTQTEVLDAATGVDQMAVASRIRGIAARIAGTLPR